MTKMHRGKKAAASLMAGILLCQMFVFGVSKTSADAREVAKKMSFEVVGEGIVTVTDTAERTQEITSGSVIEVPKGMCVRVQAESPKETDIAVHVLDKDGNYELEDVSEVQGKCFWRDVTAMELEKKVVVTFGKEDKKIRAVRTGQTRGNYNKPEAGDVFTGNCVITAVDGGNGHTVHSVTIGGFTGILAGVTATGGCADHTAAAPYVGQEYTYRYTVTGVNKVTGEVMGNLYCTSVTGATDGVTKDSGGRLIGYQRISGSALIYRNYSGYAKLKKGKTQTVLTNGNPQYSLEDACYGIYKDRSATNEAATFTTDKEGNSNTVELEEGTYYVKEKKAPKGYRLDETVYPVTVVSGQTVSVNVKDVPVYSDMELILEKIDQEYKAGKITWGRKSGRCRIYRMLLCRHI
ncbi:MAG: prealbumin-like fold domain-containing protein [Dorea longicatena]